MQIYKFYQGKVYSTKIIKETDCFYWFTDNIGAFGFTSRVEKKYACISQLQAVREALNGRRKMKGAFEDKLVKIKKEILNLESLEQEYNSPCT